MAGRISVECPGCLAKVALPDESKLGKKVKCPKCSDIFVAEAPEDEESDEVEDEAPARSKGRKRPSETPTGKGGKKRKGAGGSSGGGSNGPLIAIGGGAAVVLIGVGLWAAGVFSSAPVAAPPVAEPQPVAAAPVVAHMPPAPPTPPPPPQISPVERILALRWMPADTEMIVHAKVAEIYQAPLLKEFLNSPIAETSIKDLQKEADLLPTDVESVTIGFLDSKELQSFATTGPLGPPPQRAVIVVRTKKPMSLDHILANGRGMMAAKIAEYKSKKYIDEPSSATGYWLPEPSLLIASKFADLQGIMDRGETTIPRKELMFADPSPQLVVIAAPKNPSELLQQAKMDSLPPEYSALQTAMKESLQAASIGLSVRGGVDIQFATLMKDDQGATTVKTGVEAALVDARKMFDSLKFLAPPLVGELGEQLLNNVKIETQGAVTKLATNIPDSMQQKIEQASSGLKGSPLAGPLGSMGGPGGAPPGFNLGGDSKAPGQTEPVEPQSVEGLPEGTTLTAMTSWSQFPSIGPDFKSYHQMQIIVDLKGDDLHEICGYGQITMKLLSLAGGGGLKVSKSQSMINANVVKLIVPYEPEALSLDNAPDGTIRFNVLVDDPAASATQLAAVEGTLKILTAEDSEEFTIEDAVKLAKRPLQDPALKAAGVKLIKGNDILGEALSMSCAKGFFLGKIQATNPDSQEMFARASSTPEFEKNQMVQKIVMLGNSGKLPPKLTLVGKLYKGVKEKSVSFKFANLELPKREARPDPNNQPNIFQQPNGQPQPPQQN